MAVLSKLEFERYNLHKYQFGTDVRKKEQLYGMSGKIIYNGKWISRGRDPIIIVEMNEVITEREARFYLEVNDHNNVIRTLGYIENTSNLTILIQDFAEHTDLANVLMDNKFSFTQSVLKEMFVQVASAMSYVASKKIVHGDLGCRNVLVFRVDPSEPRNNLVKVTDFGLARWMDGAPPGGDTIVPIRYCAPEILRNNRHSSYSEKSDVYSMGVLIWEALSNSEIPYSSIADDDKVREKKLNNENLSQPIVCDYHLWGLMSNCWKRDPQERPGFAEINNRLMNMKISKVVHGSKADSSHRQELSAHIYLFSKEI